MADKIDEIKRLLAYGSQYFDKGGPVLPAITGLEAMRQYAKALKDIFRKPITVAAPETKWASIANDGRFKSQFETGTSQGEYDPTSRAETEKTLFGIPLGSDPSKRPIYGHIADLSNLGTQAYGKWGAVLDPSVKRRSTFLLGDSLMESPGPHGPYEFSEGFRKQQDNLNKWLTEQLGFEPNDAPVNFSHYGTRPFLGDEPMTAGKLSHAASIPYIETQTHGGLPFSDVRAMVRKSDFYDPKMAADNAQWMADTTGKTSFAPVKENDIGGYPLEWLQATPGERSSQIIKVPKSALTRFTGYAEGGQTEDVMPPFPLAYGSQYFDDGGQMKPVLATTGPQIMRKGLDAALQHVIEYFGGAKRPTIKHAGTEPGEVRVHPEIPYWATRFADTTWKPSASAAGSTDAQWLQAMKDAGIDVSKPLGIDDPIRRVISDYTGSSYDSMSGFLRRFADNPDKGLPQGQNYKPNLEWWRNDDSGYRVAELAKYLQDSEFELPFDIYRGNRMRGVDALPHPEHGAPQVRGTGIGSFSYTPSTAYSFGQEQTKLKQKLHQGAEDWQHEENQTKIPSVIRIPQGTKVRGMNVAQYSGLPTESEVLLAPFQGFDVTDFNLISPVQHVHGGSPRFQLNVEPSGIYDPHSPIIYNQGGQVPGFQYGGPKKGPGALPEAMRAAIEYFGGIKRNPLDRTNEGSLGDDITKWYDRFGSTNAPKIRWDKLEQKIPFPVEPPPDVQQAMRWYSGEGYAPMNSDLRYHLDKKDLSEYLRKQETNAALLARWLQDQQYELPFDVYRGSRMRAPDFTDLSHEHGPQVHGEGFGSFSFKPTEGMVWGGDTLGVGGGDVKVPGLYRIPKGTKVQGYPIAPWSEMPNEQEVLMAPFQGFDVHDTNLIKPYDTNSDYVPRLQLDISPSGIFDPKTPRIYGSGGQVPGYSDGGLTNLINYVRGLSKPVKAHHVSPHDFDRFSSNYIGSGEGNKNFGHGLYFMESPSLRDRYVKDLGEQFGGQQMRQYDVDIHGDPRHFLSLDEPLDMQGIIGARASDYLNTPKSTVLRPPELTFPRMESQVTDPAFSKYMSDEGAYGTRYFDSRSKKAGFGTQNYVTFPTMDDIIEITGKRAEGGQAPEDMPLAYMSQYYADGGQVPGYQQGGWYNEPPDRYSVSPSQFTAPRGVTTPTFNIPIGKGEATAGFSYDPESRLIDAILGYEHPLGKHGAKLGVQGNFNKYVGPGGNDVKPDWGGRIGLTLPFAEGGEVEGYAGGGQKVVDAIRKVLSWRNVSVPEAKAEVMTAVNPSYNDMLRQIKDVGKASNDPYAGLRLARDPQGNVYSWDAGAATHQGMGEALGFPVEPDVFPHIQRSSKGLEDRFGGRPFNPTTVPEWFRDPEKAEGGQHDPYEDIIEAQRLMGAYK